MGYTFAKICNLIIILLLLFLAFHSCSYDYNDFVQSVNEKNEERFKTLRREFFELYLPLASSATSNIVDRLSLVGQNNNDSPVSISQNDNKNVINIKDININFPDCRISKASGIILLQIDGRTFCEGDLFLDGSHILKIDDCYIYTQRDRYTYLTCEIINTKQTTINKSVDSVGNFTSPPPSLDSIKTVKSN